MINLSEGEFRVISDGWIKIDRADFAIGLSNVRETRLLIGLNQLLVRIAGKNVLVDAGEPHWERALQGLEAGIKRLGPLVTLQLLAIDIEVKLHRIDAAVARVDRVAAESARKETWLVRRGEILLQAGRKAEAQAAYSRALAALDTLPPARRKVPAMIDLEKKIQTALSDLKK